MNNRINLAQSEQEISDCFPVIAELRPHIKQDDFLPTVKRLIETAGYKLAYLNEHGVKAVAGFRISEWLAGGRYLEIEDLATAGDARSKGYGGELFDWLVEHAIENGCTQVRLVSRVTRFDAHRFYLNKRMIIEAHYFSLNLK